MTIDYAKLLSKSFPPILDLPPGGNTDTKYVFSITYTDPQTMPHQELSEATKAAMAEEWRDLAAYPDSRGHEGLPV